MYAPNYVYYVSQFFSEESQMIADYENINLVSNEKSVNT